MSEEKDSLPSEPPEKEYSLAETIFSKELINRLKNEDPEIYSQIIEESSSFEVQSFENHYSGPFPTPDDLERYEKTLPGFTDRLFGMFEKDQRHNQEIEKEILKGDNGQKMRGQIFGLIISLSCIAGSVFAALRGHVVFAGILGGGTVVSLAAIFVIGKVIESTERLPEEENENYENSEGE
jgi:uncharacterized membrane protein